MDLTINELNNLTKEELINKILHQNKVIDLLKKEINCSSSNYSRKLLTTKNNIYIGTVETPTRKV
tara:strand:+ start:674 stop:868 length:195 start_codon:yes stop_codon:yes gene_type:complete